MMMGQTAARLEELKKTLWTLDIGVISQPPSFVRRLT